MKNNYCLYKTGVFVTLTGNIKCKYEFDTVDSIQIIDGKNWPKSFFIVSKDL